MHVCANNSNVGMNSLYMLYNFTLHVMKIIQLVMKFVHMIQILTTHVMKNNNSVMKKSNSVMNSLHM